MVKDYSKGKIYKIVNDENNNIYYGSTVQPLSKRMGNHRKKHNHCMTKNLGVDLKYCKIILVEDFPCERKEQLLMRERHFTEFQQCVNKVKRPIITEEERKEKMAEIGKKNYIKNREKISIRSKKYRDENPEKISIRSKKYRDENPEKESIRSKKYRDENPEKIAEIHKKYRDENPEKIAEINKKYRDENKEKLREKYTCDCGSSIRKDSKNRHEKTKKHQTFINS